VLEETLPFLIGRGGYPFFGEAAMRAAEYWQIVLGPMLLAIVLFARGGIYGLLTRADRD